LIFESGRIGFPEEYTVEIQTSVGWIADVFVSDAASPTFLDGTSGTGGRWIAGDERRPSLAFSLSGPPRGHALKATVLISSETNPIPSKALTIQVLTTDFRTAVDYSPQLDARLEKPAYSGFW